MQTLSPDYSTTRLVTREPPFIEESSNPTFKTALFLPERERLQGEGGLRTQGYFKHSLPDKPLITVITVVFNGEKYLEETILSVINQTYDNVEYIIIDGGSTDGSLDIIRKYEHAIDYWLSERDGGIYHAMNKGLDLTTGDWVNFMNAGDIFFKRDVLNEIFNNFYDKNTCFIYGNVVIDKSYTKEEHQAGYIKNIYKGMQFSHQSLFTKSIFHKKNKFELKYHPAADYAFLYKSWTNGKSFLKKEITISKVTNNGVSDRKRISSMNGMIRVIFSKKSKYPHILFALFLYLKVFFHFILKTLFFRRRNEQ